MITSRFVADGSLYGITTWTVTPAKIKLAVSTYFAESICIVALSYLYLLQRAFLHVCLGILWSDVAQCVYFLF